MSKPTAENVAAVVNGLKQFFGHMLQTKTFNPQEFMNFMEPIFAQAGYRDTEKINLKTMEGGNLLIVCNKMAAGDFVLHSASIREIRRLYPGAHITLVTSANVVSLAEFCPYVNELIISAPSHVPVLPNDFLHNISLAENLLKRRFDVCYAFAMSNLVILLMYMSGARIRVTQRRSPEYGAEYSDYPMAETVKLATHLFPTFGYGRHAVDDNLSLVDGMLGMPTLNRAIEVWYTPLDVAQAKVQLQGASSPLYALFMGGSIPIKHYPPEKYARLLEMILDEEPSAMFVILGGGQWDLQSAEIIKNVAPKIYEENIIDLTNKADYRRSAAIFSFCDMYIGNDSGSSQLAAAVKCPVLSPNAFADDLPKNVDDDIIYVYSPYNVPAVVVRPEHALPECRNGHVKYVPSNYGCTANVPHCITQIEPETLFKGFHLLKERIAQGNCEPLYIY